MTFLIVLALYVGILFIMGYASRRSMGVPSLALAAGAGVNPIGDLALERAEWSPERCTCADPGAEPPQESA